MEALTESSGTESISFLNRTAISEEAVDGVEESSSRKVKEAHKYIGRFFYVTGIDFCAAKSPSFEKLLNCALGSGQLRLKIPTSQDLKGWILRDSVEEMQQYVKDIKESWESTGCSILLDGWVDPKGRSLINILVECPKGTLYLRSSNISAIDGDIDAMLAFLDEILEEVGVNNVIQIITYSTSAYMEELGKQVMDKHRILFWTVSASHCLELMLNKFLMIDSFKHILEKAKIIARFIYNDAAVLKLLGDRDCLDDLIKRSKIKSITPLLTLENIVIKEERVTRFFTSSYWKTSIWANTREGNG